MRWQRIGYGVALSCVMGCSTGSDGEPPKGVASRIEGVVATGVAHGPSVLGPGEALAIWRVNELGVAVPGGDIELAVDGESVVLPVDDTGRAWWQPPGPGVYGLDWGDGAVDVKVHEADWRTAELDPVLPVEASLTHTVTLGDMAVAALEGQGVVALDPYRGLWPVAGPPGEIRSLKAVALDEDGVRDDLLVVTEEAILLMARQGDALVWRGGLASGSVAFRGAGVGDLDDDGRLELLVSQDMALDWWGFGDDGLTWIRRREVGVEVFDVGVASTPGADVATVMLDDGWLRLQYAAGEMLDVGPDAPKALAGSRLLATGADVTGSGLEELVLLPRGARDPLGQVVVASLGEGGDQSITERSWPDGSVTLADADGSGAMDLVAIHGEGEVKRLGWAPDGPREWSLGRLPLGPVVIQGAAPGALGSLLVGGDGVVKVYTGGANDRSPWRPRERRRTVLGTVRPTQVVSWDDGDPATGSFAAVLDDEGVMSLATFVWSDFPAQKVDRVGETTLEEGEDLIEVAVCGLDALLLTDRRLLRVSLDGPHTVVAERASSAGRAVACAAGGSAWVGALVADGDLLIVDGGLEPLEDAVGSVASGVAVAPAVEGARPEVATCGAPGCQVRWVGSAAGAPVFLTQAGEGGPLERASEGGGLTEVLPGALEGWTVADVDGDGHLDVVAVDGDGVVYALRSVAGQGWSLAAAHRHPFGAWEGSVAATDLDGDGVVEVVGVEEQGRVAVWVTLE